MRPLAVACMVFPLGFYTCLWCINHSFDGGRKQTIAEIVGGIMVVGGIVAVGVGIGLSL